MMPYEEVKRKKAAARNSAVAEDNEQLLGEQGRKNTYMVNGKEKKKPSKKQKKQNLSKEKRESDPISQLGFGIVAYIGMLYYMIWAFSLFSFILIPVFSFYNHGKAYKEAD